jgi:hypothetical protein
MDTVTGFIPTNLLIIHDESNNTITRDELTTQATIF